MQRSNCTQLQRHGGARRRQLQTGAETDAGKTAAALAKVQVKNIVLDVSKLRCVTVFAPPTTVTDDEQ